MNAPAARDIDLVVGAGPLGRQLAALLVASGRSVVLANTSGTGPAIGASSAGGAVRRVALDARSPAAVMDAARGCRAVFNCLNPSSYSTWPREWPLMSEALLAGAADAGAVLVAAGNLYPYGVPTEPIVEGQADRPVESKGRVRAEMTEAALERHRNGVLNYVEVRASDYVGPEVRDSGILTRLIPQAVARSGGGGQIWTLRRPNQPHTWTDVRDLARALAAVADLPHLWGKVWHAPSTPPKSQQAAGLRSRSEAYRRF